MKCRYCKLDKENEYFAPSAFIEYSKGNVPKCRECASKLNKAWRLANTEKVKAYQHKRRAVPDIREKDRIRSLRTKYGMSVEEYNKLLILQNSKCYICGSNQNVSRWGVLCVDHDHTTGSIRKLLCAPCNKGLGCFKDSPELLAKAKDYLVEHLPWQK